MQVSLTVFIAVGQIQVRDILAWYGAVRVDMQKMYGQGREKLRIGFNIEEANASSRMG